MDVGDVNSIRNIVCTDVRDQKMDWQEELKRLMQV